MYVVAMNTPYYPEVKFCETLEQAYVIRDDMLKGRKEGTGEYENRITIGQVLEITGFRSHY